MTHQMILSAPLSGYGACELKQKMQKFTISGLTLAALLYGLGLATYWYAVGQEHNFIKPRHIIIVGGPELVQPPSIGGVPIDQIGIRVASLSASLKEGRFVPVPDIMLNPDEPDTPTGYKGTDGPVVDGPVGGGIPESWKGVDPNPDDQPPPPFKRVEKQPIIVKRVNPLYPEIARLVGIEGRVWANVWIDKEGKIRQVVIIKSDSELFNDAVIQAINQYVFAPALMSNGPVPVWLALRFDFKLNK
jgi:TonB family protein